METYPVSLALFDFIPTLAFLTGAFYLVRTGVLCRGKPCGRMVMAGGLLVFLGGFFKATWKLLYTTGSRRYPVDEPGAVRVFFHRLPGRVHRSALHGALEAKGSTWRHRSRNGSLENPVPIRDDGHQPGG